MGKKLTDKELVWEMVKANREMELSDFLWLMLDFKFSSPKTHQLLLELEEERKLKLHRVCNGTYIDLHYKKRQNVEFYIEILQED